MATDLTRSQEELLYDPQTSGGLLLSLPKDQAQKLLLQLHGAGIDAAVRIGGIINGVPGITVQ
jgi:selenide,water dikinase